MDSGEVGPCVTPSLLRQYLYCPMAAYFIARGLAEPETERMREGRELEASAALPIEAERVEYGVAARSGDICGVIDAVVWIGGRPYPVEIKGLPRPRPIPLGHRVQAVAYAMLVEAKYGRAVPKAYLYYAESGQLAEVPAGPAARKLVQDTAKRLLRILDGHVPEPNQPPRKCAGCWYRKYCGAPHAPPQPEVKGGLAGEAAKTGPRPPRRIDDGARSAARTAKR